MTRPVVAPVTERLYRALGPFTDGDDTRGWPLLRFCDTVAAPVADVEVFSADSDAGDGWTPLLDVTRCPTRALPYLGQFVGAQVPPEATDGQARQIIQHAPGWARGTPASIIGAARVWLTGTQYVGLNERVGGDAYAVEVVVYEAQAIDVGKLTAAIQAAMPAGLSLTLTVISGWTVAQMETETSTHNVAWVEAGWATVNDFEHQLP